MAPSQPIYADRETGATFSTARQMIDTYLERFSSRAGIALPRLDDTGFVRVRKGSATIGINVLDDHGVLLFVAPIFKIPPSDREALFRRLLELSFLSTSDAAFAIDRDSDEICVRALRRLSGLDYEEFEDLLDTVGKVADEWDDALMLQFRGR